MTHCLWVGYSRFALSVHSGPLAFAALLEGEHPLGWDVLRALAGLSTGDLADDRDLSPGLETLALDVARHHIAVVGELVSLPPFRRGSLPIACYR